MKERILRCYMYPGLHSSVYWAELLLLVMGDKQGRIKDEYKMSHHKLRLYITWDFTTFYARLMMNDLISCTIEVLTDSKQACFLTNKEDPCNHKR
jgi:hypothetical protein